MAVTITNTFNDVVALQKPLVLTASSTNTSEPKFRYVMTVDVNNVEVVKVKQQPNAGGDVHFDLYQIIKDYFETKYLDGGTEIHKIITTVDGEKINVLIEDPTTLREVLKETLSASYDGHNEGCFNCAQCGDRRGS